MRNRSRANTKRRSAEGAMLAVFICAICAMASTPNAYAENGGTALGASSVDLSTAPGTLGTEDASHLAVGQTFTKGGNTYQVTDVDRDAGDLSDVKLVKYGATSTKPAMDTVAYRGTTYEIDIIGKNAFNNVRGHKTTTVTFGRHVDKLQARALYGCSKLKVIDLAKCDVVDIDKGRNGYYIDEIDIGSKAFTNAGVKGVKVKCGKSSTSYQKLFKKALVKKGLRSDAIIVK